MAHQISYISVLTEPPYAVQEQGYAGFELPIDIYFKNKEEPRKIRFKYDLFLKLEDCPPVNHIRCEKLTFQNPTDEFKKKLLKAGGVGFKLFFYPPSTSCDSNHLRSFKIFRNFIYIFVYLYLLQKDFSLSIVKEFCLGIVLENYSDCILSMEYFIKINSYWLLSYKDREFL